MGAKFKSLFHILNDVIGEKEKVLVFSGFKTALIRCADAATSLLKASLMKPRKIFLVSGENPVMKRAAIFEVFQSPESGGAICFVVTGIGGVGLNLTKCHHGILLEPCFNPQVERQAVSRMWRLGQEHTVRVFKLVVKSSIEERMVAMQKKKLRTAEQVFEASLFSTYGPPTTDLYDLPTKEELDSLCVQECKAAAQDKKKKEVKKTIIELFERIMQKKKKKKNKKK